MADNCNLCCSMSRDGCLHCWQNSGGCTTLYKAISQRRNREQMPEYILSLLIGETTMRLNRWAQPWEEGRIKILQECINVCSIGLAVQFHHWDQKNFERNFPLRIHTYISEGFVPWCATMTEACDGEKPTYPKLLVGKVIAGFQITKAYRTEQRIHHRRMLLG